MRIGDKKIDEISDSQYDDNSLNSHISDISEMIQLAERLLNTFELRISIIDMKNELIYTSGNSEKIIGYTFDNFKFLETYGYVHPDDREKIKKKLSNFKKNDFTDPVNYRIFKPNGELRWIRGTAHKYVDTTTNRQLGYFLIEFDVTFEHEKEDVSNIEDSLFKSLTNFNYHPILYTINHQIVWVNKKWLNMFGYSEERIMNQPIGFLFADQDEYAEFLFACNKTLKKTGNLEFLATLVDNKKGKIAAKINAYAVDKNKLSTGILLNFTDISEGSKIEKTVEDDYNFLISLAGNLDLAIIYVKDQKITWTNEYFTNYLQYDKEEVIDKDLSIIFPTKNAFKDFISDVNRRFLLKKNFLGEVTFLQKDKKPVVFNARAISSNYDNNSVMALALEPNNELRKLVNQLRDEKNQLEFYSDLLFHDVRNLCQDALLQLDLSIRNTKTSPDDSIRKQNKSRLEIIRIGELISNIDKFFRTKRKDYDIFSVDIFSSFEKAFDKIQMKFEHREIKINHNLKRGKNLTLANEWLEDIFFNLLDNAVRYDRDSVAKVDIKIQKSEEHTNYWKIIISDNGPGIGDELKKNLFDRYVRSKGTIHGSGFGLTLVKVIIDSFNGFVSVEDRDPMNRSKGSKFILELPIFRTG